MNLIFVKNITDAFAKKAKNHENSTAYSLFWQTVFDNDGRVDILLFLHNRYIIFQQVRLLFIPFNLI